MPNKDAQIIARIILFAHEKVGSEWGWQKRFAEFIGISAPQLNNILAARAPVGPAIRERLVKKGCNGEWLTTGEAKESPTVSRDDQQMLELLRDRGIRTAADLDQCISDREKLKRALGPVAYQTFVETAVAVGEKQARFRGKRKRT